MPCQWQPIPPPKRRVYSVSFRHARAQGSGSTTAANAKAALFNVVLRFARDRKEAVFIVADLNKGMGTKKVDLIG